MKIEREYYKSPKDVPHDEYLSPGSSLCAGCGALATLRLMHKVLGEQVVIVNAAGCLTLLATYPFTPMRSSWLYTTMASARLAQGIRDALDVLSDSGRLPAEEDLQVVVLAGDGSTYDMGLSSTSGAIDRGLDFWYLCYDNEAYGNTGFQTSAASPLGSRTATCARGCCSAEERHLRDLACPSASLYRHGFLARPGRSGREGPSRRGAPRPEAVSLAGRLPHRLGLRATVQ